MKSQKKFLFSKELKFHHYGIAVRSFKNTIKFYKNLNYKINKKIIDKNQNVELVLCVSKTFPSVELVKPINKKSPITRILKENDTSIYHVCYEAKKKTLTSKIF